MSRESRKVFSILITLLLLLRSVTIILIAFIVTLARRKEREKTICCTRFPRRRSRIYSTLSGVVSSEFLAPEKKRLISLTHSPRNTSPR